MIGKIVKVTDTTLTYQQIENLKGKPLDSVTIQKKQGSANSTRAIPTNKPGQIELIFFNYYDYTNSYDFFADYSECLIKDSTVYLYGRSWYLKKNREKYQLIYSELDGKFIDAAGYGKAEICQAIKDYLKEYKWIGKKIRKEKDIKYVMSRSLPQKEEVIIKNKEINTFASKSKSHQRIIDELIDDPNNNIPW